MYSDDYTFSSVNSDMYVTKAANKQITTATTTTQKSLENQKKNSRRQNSALMRYQKHSCPMYVSYNIVILS